MEEEHEEINEEINKENTNEEIEVSRKGKIWVCKECGYSATAKEMIAGNTMIYKQLTTPYDNTNCICKDCILK